MKTKASRIRAYINAKPGATTSEICQELRVSRGDVYNVRHRIKARRAAMRRMARIGAAAAKAAPVISHSDLATPEEEEAFNAIAANATQVGGQHYKSKAIQPWDYIASNNLGYLEGNVVKYVSRWKDKGGVEDLKKAQHYLAKLIEVNA